MSPQWIGHYRMVSLAASSPAPRSLGPSSFPTRRTSACRTRFSALGVFDLMTTTYGGPVLKRAVSYPAPSLTGYYDLRRKCYT